jgi:hypothetical protein
MSSPNFPEKGVANLSESYYFIEIRHKIFILGA